MENVQEILTEVKALDEKIGGIGNAVKEYRETVEKADKERAKFGSELAETTEKLAKFEKSFEAIDKLNDRLTKAEAEAKAAAEETKARAEQMNRIETAIKRAPRGGPEDRVVSEEDKVFWKYMQYGSQNEQRAGSEALSVDEVKMLRERRVSDKLDTKSLGLGNDTTAGFLAPTEYVREIIKAAIEYSPIRSIARVRPTTMRSMQVPKRTANFAAQWVAEQGTRSETTGLAYGLEEVAAHEMYGLVDTGEQLLEDSAFNLEAELTAEFAEQFGVAEGAAFVNGNGAGKPEGFMQNTAIGFTVSGDANEVKDATGTADGLINLYHALKTEYARNGTWVLNRTTLGAVRRLKEATTNAYIWQPGLADLRPSTILGAPYVEVPDMPPEGTDTFPIAFGDFRRAYVIVDRIVMSLLRDPYTQATSGNIRYIARKRVGGQVMLAEAIRKLKCST